MGLQVRDESVMDRDDLTRRNIMDGDSFLAQSPSYRFAKPQIEPYMPNLAEGG